MIEYKRPSKELINEFKKYSTCNVSDALDKLNLKSGICGIRPFFECQKIVGPALTLRMTAEGESKSKSHLGADVIEIGQKGDIIVIDNAGRKDQNCWGGILTIGAMQKEIEGVIIDGAFRDLDEIEKEKFPVYARSVVPRTARGRFMQESFNKIIQCGGVQVRPADIVMADKNGVVVIPREKARSVLEKTREFYEKEERIIEQLKSGKSFKEVDRKSKYNQMVE